MRQIVEFPHRDKPTLALRRDAPVVCTQCGRTVTRQARQQKYCSTRCRELAKQHSRKAFLDHDTRTWRSVVSSDGVVCEVSTLRKRALRDGGAR